MTTGKRSDAVRMSRLRGLNTQHLDRAAAEDVVDSQHRHSRRKGPSRPMMQAELGILQPRRQSAVNPRLAYSVKVAQQNNRILAVGMAKPAGAEQRVNLHQTLESRQTQMRVNDLNLGVFYLDCSPECAAGL